MRRRVAIVLRRWAARLDPPVVGPTFVVMNASTTATASLGNVEWKVTGA